MALFWVAPLSRFKTELQFDSLTVNGIQFSGTFGSDLSESPGKVAVSL